MAVVELGGAGVHRGDTLFALIAPTVLSQYGLQCLFQSNEDREKKESNRREESAQKMERAKEVILPHSSSSSGRPIPTPSS